MRFQIALCLKALWAKFNFHLASIFQASDAMDPNAVYRGAGGRGGGGSPVLPFRGGAGDPGGVSAAQQHT